MTALNLDADVTDLTAALVDIESVSGNEKEITDAIEAALTPVPWLTLHRQANSLLARTTQGRPDRVVIAGHVDTVPVHDNLPAHLDGDVLYGLGSCDMKGGVAVALKLAAGVPAPNRDVTYIFYEAEEVEADRNGLGHVAAARPDLLEGEFAILMEPSNAVVEAGCQGTMRAEVRTTGVRAHSARAWKGVNAIHEAEPILARLRAYEPRRPEIDGLQYREGLNAVGIAGGVAGNVLPDSCTVTVNYRFAPDRSAQQAADHLREVFTGYDVQVTDYAAGALPGLSRPAAASFVEAVGGQVNPKFGWTDVSRFSALGVPAVNFGPGDPELAHSQHEHVPVAQLSTCLEQLSGWLEPAGSRLSS